MPSPAPGNSKHALTRYGYPVVGTLPMFMPMPTPRSRLSPSAWIVARRRDKTGALQFRGQGVGDEGRSCPVHLQLRGVLKPGTLFTAGRTASRIPSLCWLFTSLPPIATAKANSHGHSSLRVLVTWPCLFCPLRLLQSVTVNSPLPTIFCLPARVSTPAFPQLPNLVPERWLFWMPDPEIY
ncbi:hypothetical protein NA56DRAFT_664973 [Hyaloscypha hepaticicola]|uniref:Uncharacterized protein n=1 Tax=Hyaloscypha hepaticicola TaxID=2082293 RepID=A0A2J6PJL2_9HELO|nr:hypothetical protein NA56DRAFT_664973 [Hyaloscypha hepaticicola]